MINDKREFAINVRDTLKGKHYITGKPKSRLFFTDLLQCCEFLVYSE